MSKVKDILRYISPNTSFVVNLDDYKTFIEIAKAEEQERIIKLLEDEVRHDFPPIIEMSLDNLKALIKGEQK